MRVLMVAPTPYFSDRGCHVQIYEEARALSARGHEVSLVAYGHGRDVGDFPILRAATLLPYRKVSAGPSLHKAWADPALFAAARKEARRLRPDVIHAHLHEGAAIALALRRLFGIPVFAELQGSLTGELAAHGWGAAASLLGPVERRLVGSPDAVGAPSASFVEALARRWGADPSRTFVVGSGVDAGRFAPGEADAALRARWGLPARERIVLYLGLLTGYQGVPLLLRAATRFLSADPSARLLVMGYPDEARWAEEAAGMGLDGRAVFTGRIGYEDAPAHLRLGAIGVSAKGDTTEGNGKLHDYMAAGLAVVAADTPVNREILGEAGVYFPSGDADALAEAVEGLLADPARSAGLGAQARSRAMAELGWDAVALRLEEGYAAAIQHRTSEDGKRRG